jgi:hypothetical protein
VINKALAPVEQMLYLSQWFQKVGFTDVLKGAYGREWVKCPSIIYLQRSEGFFLHEACHMLLLLQFKHFKQSDPLLMTLKEIKYHG